MNAETPILPPLDVLIVGAGISGIGIAAHLVRECPDKRFVIVERRARPGGTWDLFRYPGVRSDSDMFTLGYGFAPWRHDKTIVGGDMILDYLNDVVDDHRLRERMRFGQTVVSANWDSASALWTAVIEDEAGQRREQSARFLFVGTGYYDYEDPYDAQIPGLDSFGGLTVHPQFWPKDLDYVGKKVVIIGSGATAATLVPAMAETAAQVTMLQRTPSWYLTRPALDKVASWLRRLLPDRLAHTLSRIKNVRMQDFLFSKSRDEPEAVKAYLRKQLEDQLGSDYDREAFTPPYGPWEQRLCLIPDGDLFAALNAGKAEIVTGRIAEVDRTGLKLEDGRHLDADLIVTATGLRVMLLGKIALTLDGAPIVPGEHYYYRNCMFSNVPNFVAPFGYLNASWTLRIDLVGEWLGRLLRHMDQRRLDVVTPVLPPDHALTEVHPFDGFSSGYLARARDCIPKSAATAPWQIGMNYTADRKEMRAAPIDDGVLRFERAPVPASAQ
ncbi:flavin-containing monooxygenase [Novosphingobium sp. JCM 18896]|uniref:flavin-containing monooxygenase n=1 Tax=Novosphingobium sp. JCM 18896 TaxID=2989731 RepID=UPI002222726B|nr:NAD(P)/FAD-dependent oxidoreductase [Novosphingobium sp. JCM 18896]MCW1427663.1 NAD(P)/FAD-dependent oxidoreductase [Novosphingobium sp. JCM 18896]